MTDEEQIESQKNIIKIQEGIIENANTDIENADANTDNGKTIIENANQAIENANKLIENANQAIEELKNKQQPANGALNQNDSTNQQAVTPQGAVITKEENIYVKFDGLTYTILTEKEGKPQMEKEENEPVKTVFLMTRSDATKCFTLNDGSKTEVKSGIAKYNPMNLFKGGKLKTKKRRITKKRVQKLRPFKSRSKK